jgi:SAM-dependent methyltransferase
MAAVEWVLRGPNRRVADLGAGTGALTRLLEERVARVLAVEPDARMVDVLRRRSPEVPAVQSWAEHLPLRPGSLDAVTVASAWHWMDPEPTLAEIGRVLRPGGVLGVIWNGADRTVGWVADLLGARDPSPGDRDRGERHRFALPAGTPFEEPEETVVEWTMAMTGEQLVGLAATYSSTITMTPDEREQELARVDRAASSVAGDGEVVVPMRCRCWRAVRR